MKARAATVGVITALIGFGAGGSLALAGEFTPPEHAKNENAQNGKPGEAPPPSPGQSQYPTRPGKGCGDKNHTHTGPPGNPENKECPPTAGPKPATTTGSKSKTKAKSKYSASCKKAIAKAKKKKAGKRAKAKARSCRAKANKKARAKAKAKARAKAKKQKG